MCTTSLSRRGTPPRNLIKLQLQLCSKYSAISSFIYIETDMTTKSGVFSRQISVNSPSKHRHLRIGAQILRAKLSKYDNARLSRSGQLEIRLSITSGATKT
jgi:hypothetical protein